MSISANNWPDRAAARFAREGLIEARLNSIKDLGGTGRAGTESAKGTVGLPPIGSVQV